MDAVEIHKRIDRLEGLGKLLIEEATYLRNGLLSEGMAAPRKGSRVDTKKIIAKRALKMVTKK